MHFNYSYVLPIVLSTALHALVITGMMMNWESEITITVTSDERYYIEASVVRENPNKVAKREKEKAAISARAARQRENEAKEAADRRKEQERQQQARAEREQITEQYEMPELVDLQELEKIDSESEISKQLEEAERQRMEERLVMEILEEQEYRRAITDDEKAMAYVAQIKREIVQNWSRPPSARRDMEALLRVRLVPTGEVVHVSIAKSSGNSAFDRSALLAVEKAERFQVPNDSRQFERNFREFNVLFRPEDLRL